MKAHASRSNARKPPRPSVTSSIIRLLLHVPKESSRKHMSSTSDTPRRISHTSLFIVTILLVIVAEFAIPGGLTPRRVKQQILAKRVAEHLDIISETDPEEVTGGPFPIDSIHRKALYHRGVWIFALDSHLRLLLSWRAPQMKTCPMTWAPLGEHAISNESLEEAAKRGVQEEASFVVRPRMYKVGQPFLYQYTYANGSDEQRVDNQWTQAYVVLPRGDALDFRTLDDREAQTVESGAENLRYQGMGLPDVVKHGVQKPGYFCNAVQVKWMLRIIPLVIRVIRARDKRLYRAHLREHWGDLVREGSPVCCQQSQHETVKGVDEVNVTACGVPCQKHTVDAEDAEVFA